MQGEPSTRRNRMARLVEKNVAPSRLRLGYAGALTATLIVVIAATGGVGYAASTVQDLVRVVHHTTVARRAASDRAGSTNHPTSGAITSGCSQLAIAPVVTFRSARGRVGSTVTIKGDHFYLPGGTNGITSVTFAGGESAKFDVPNSSSLTTTVPEAAQSGGITVANCAGSATSAVFAVTP